MIKFMQQIILKSNLIHGGNFSENEIILELRKLFKKELDNLADKNTLITKNKMKCIQ
jgi:hypothetical protein